MDLIQWEEWFGKELVGTVKRITSYLKDGDVFVDIGSNTGLLSKLILKELKEEDKELSKVIMFEPVPLYYNECVKKFGDNDKFIINNLALSNDTEDKTLLVSHRNFGYNKIYKEGMEIHPHDKIQINCDLFSNWMFKHNIDKIDFIKIDAEGHDREVIEGMFNWLKETHQRPYIQFEGTWYPSEEKDLLEKMREDFNYKFDLQKTDYILYQ